MLGLRLSWNSLCLQVSIQKRLSLLMLMLDDERERLQTWAQQLNNGTPRSGVAGSAWHDYAHTAWNVDPNIALALLDRFALGAYMAALHSFIYRKCSVFQAPFLLSFSPFKALPFLITIEKEWL